MTRGGPAEGLEASLGRQRLDKWLWFARVVKTRSLAARLVADGHVRVNSMRADSPAKMVKPGDVLTIALDRAVRVMAIVAPGDHRGPYAEARTLYRDLGLPASDAPRADPDDDEP